MGRRGKKAIGTRVEGGWAGIGVQGERCGGGGEPRAVGHGQEGRGEGAGAGEAGGAARSRVPSRLPNSGLSSSRPLRVCPNNAKFAGNAAHPFLSDL